MQIFILKFSLLLAILVQTNGVFPTATYTMGQLCCLVKFGRDHLFGTRGSEILIRIFVL